MALVLLALSLTYSGGSQQPWSLFSGKTGQMDSRSTRGRFRNAAEHKALLERGRAVLRSAAD